MTNPGSVTTTQYGFDWGAVTVERIAHVEGRGYVIEVRPKGDRSKYVQVYVSEQGRSVRAYARGRVKVTENP